MSYSVVKTLLDIIISTFFRQVDTVGTYHIPETGPVIFVANHANQFVDPMMLIAFIPRVIRFLIAAKSLTRPIIGHLARGVGAIGVERPQDITKKGSGTVSATSGATIATGFGTSFTKDLQKGFKIKTSSVELVVKSVESDTSCTIDPCPEAISESGYKILPKIDQNEVYFQVHKALKAGDCIGIFPEGGSHDQAHMLDLKPGVAIMALGAMQAGAADVKIVPCGLNYFEPYRFRSRVVVEFGEPIAVPASLVEEYKTNRREAVESLMKLVEAGMKHVMPGAEDYAEMQAIVTMRALWKPRDRKVTAEEGIKITRTFAKGIQLFKKDERVGNLVREVREYNDALQAGGYRDRDVRMNFVSNTVVWRRTLLAILEFIWLLPFACFFYILFVPVAMLTYVAAMREKKHALANSSVKVKALDVVASQKIKVAIVLMPLYQFVLTFIVITLTGTGWKGFVFLSIVFWPPFTVIGCRTCDRFYRVVVRCKTNFNGRKSAPLVERRVTLVAKIRKLVEELGPKVVEDWDQKRIISGDELDRDDKKNQQILRNLSNEDLAGST